MNKSQNKIISKFIEKLLKYWIMFRNTETEIESPQLGWGVCISFNVPPQELKLLQDRRLIPKKHNPISSSVAEI